MNMLTEISYSDGDIPLTGLHAAPEQSPIAAVTVFPTFINSTPTVEAKALALVEARYAVMVADFYGPDAPSNMEEGFAAMGALTADPQAMRRRLRASLEATKALAPDVPQLAIGFCLGGMAVLEMARDGQDLAGVVSFHGILESALPADKPITPRILICHGDADSLVPRSQVVSFWEEMDAVQADWHFHSYAGVEHGFTAPIGLDGKPNPNFDASADHASWLAMMGFFQDVLG